MDEITNKASDATAQQHTIRVQTSSGAQTSGHTTTQQRPTNFPSQTNSRSPQMMHKQRSAGMAGGVAGAAKNLTSHGHMSSTTSKRLSSMKSEKILGILDKVIALCVFMLFFGLPLFFVNITYQGVGFEKMYYFYLWTFVGIVTLIARGMLGGKIEIRRTPLDIPLGIFWAVSVLSMVFSVDRYHSIFGFFGVPVNGVVSITALIFAYYLIVSYVTKERVMMIWWAMIASGSIVTIWSFLTTLRIVPDKVLEYITPSLTGSFTGLAIFLGMLLPFYIMSFSVIGADVRSSVRAKIVAVFLACMLLIDIMTLSILFGYVRWFVIIGSVGLLLVFVISRIVSVSQKTIGITIFVFLMLLTLFMWGQPIITRTAIQTEALINFSLSLGVAKEALAENPLIGSGPGTYGYNFSQYKPDELNRSGQYDVRFYSDRGILMESLSTIGIIGTTALIVVVLTYISTIMHAFVQSKDEEVKIISLGLIVATAVSLIFTMFWSVDSLIIAYGVLVGATSMGILRGSLAEANDNKYALSMSASPQHALSFAFLSILIAVGVIFGFVTLGKMFVADVYAGNALRARAMGEYEKSANYFEKAVSLNGGEGRYYTVISQYGLDLANMELAKEESQRNADAIAQYIKGATGAAMIGKNMMPNDVLANETVGFVYENSGGYVQGALTTAMSAYQRARELEPSNPYLDIAVGKMKLVEAQSKQGEGTEAEKTALINEAKVLFEDAKNKTTFDYNGQQVSIFAPAHYYLSVVEEALGNVDEAISAMSMALQVTQIAGSGNQEQQLSREINYGFNLARLLQARGTEEDNANAEKLLLQIIGVNDKEVNSHLNLGLLYERTDRKDEAISEYKKILEMLPEEDTKARENIQNLIDTVEQGGSNIEENQGDAVSDEGKAQEGVTQKNDLDEAVAILVVKGGDSGDRANQGLNVLKKGGYDVQMRDVDESYDGVTVAYGANVDQEEATKIKNALQEQFGNDILVQRNDAEVSKYDDFDVVVTVGKAEEQIQNENVETQQ